MWATGATHMIARLTGSTLFANHHLVSILTVDHRLVSTGNEKIASTSAGKSSNLITKMRDLRARNPYALFIKDNYHEISAKHPDLKLADISKKAAEMWRSLSDEKKQGYAKKSQDQKTNYEQEKQRLSPNDLQTVDADEKAKRIEHRVKKSIQQLPTKRPRTAYAHYLSALDRGEADLKDFMKGAAQRWSQMTVEDKQKYEDLHQEEKQQYAKTLVAWASANEQASKPTPRRSSSSASSKTKDVKAKTTRAKSATSRRTTKKRTSASSKTAVSATKSTRTKSSKAASDKEGSSSSSDDESSTKIKKSTK